MSRIHDIARKAKVSTATVSRVFNKKPYVKNEVKKKVLDIAKELNYSPKFTARKNNIAIIVESLNEINLGNYETLLITTISKHLIKNKLAFEIISVDELNNIYQNFTQGAIAIIYRPASIAKIKEIKRFPVLTINYSLANIHSVCSDHKQGVKIAVEYLVKHGHRRIGLLLSSTKSWGGRERLEAYKESIKELDLQLEQQLIQAVEKDHIFIPTAKIISENPTAMLVCGEDIIFPVISALGILKRKVPDDISIISSENKLLSPYFSPPHTTVSQHLEKIGSISVKTILEMIDEKGEDIKKTNIKYSLIERDSVRNLK